MNKDLRQEIRKIISKNCQIGYGFDDEATADKILSLVYSHLEKKIEKEYNSQKVPASYEIAHYKMGLEKSLQILKEELK